MRPLPEPFGAVSGGPSGAMESCFARNGAVLLRSCLDRAPLEAAARAIGARLVAGGWATPSTGGLAPAVSDPGAPDWSVLSPTPGQRQAFRDICCLEEIHVIGHQPALVELVRIVLGAEDLLVHPRPVCRVVAPVGRSGDVPTPPHQDHVNMQGTPRAVVAWMPLADCPLESGPVVVAAGSHRGGPRPHSRQPVAGVAVCSEADLAGAWMGSDLRLGDVVLFDASSVHKALPNRSGRFRFSVDLRFQPVSEPVCSLSLAGFGDLDWDDVYASWDASARPPVGGRAPRRYWCDLSLRTVAYDPSYWRADIDV